LTPLVDWVEKGVVPEAVIATARPASQNPGVGTIPTGRTRPLCPWPKVARYEGGNSELASSFACK
ncbi:MAG TPA: tannase/feruloyl esterase family alpha/beta hydrolase, partial [Rubrivivax sp.]|nr:tannase/feruloyl esterase family alpha/beta hydrolase [Rubrivivax sp.]